tara:strand:- start:129 stop:326 length:198 start_codon:yes stop_codon:yes gene_type:complete
MFTPFFLLFPYIGFLCALVDFFPEKPKLNVTEKFLKRRFVTESCEHKVLDPGQGLIRASGRLNVI